VTITGILALLFVMGLVGYVMLGRLQANRRANIGLTGAAALTADDTRIGSPTLRSERLGLVGRPDRLVRIRGQLIPVSRSRGRGGFTIRTSCSSRQSVCS
jgi:hypothetical protein